MADPIAKFFGMLVDIDNENKLSLKFVPYISYSR